MQPDSNCVDYRSSGFHSKANVYSMFSGTIPETDGLSPANAATIDESDRNGDQSLDRNSSHLPQDGQMPASDHTGESDADDLQDASFCYRALRSCKCCYERLLRWPRISAMILGVTLPMFFLILLSAVFGLFLAYAEAPLEIQLNDASLAQNSLERTMLYAVVNITDITPTLCLNMFLSQVNVTSIASFLRQHVFLSNVTLTPIINGTFAADPDPNETSGDDIVAFNKTALYEFMRSCGAEVSPLVEGLFRNTSSAYRDIVASDLTFNWIRCYPGAQGSGVRSGMSGATSIDEFRYDAQLDWYEKSWKKSQTTYYQVVLDQILAQGNMTLEDAKLQATRESYRLATGAKGCTLNIPASGWFWFTVLSTCGYGNTAPESTAGQAMVFTLGFLSIMAFAGILATAGFIASSIFDDAMVRLRLRAVTHPLVAMAAWASMYYLWMVAIAAATIHWKHVRMGDESFGMSQAYWFAYISSTTVGLGDVWFEPEVFLYRDLLLFPLMWLVGFVLVAAFFAKFGETWVSIVGRRSFVTDALSRLHKTDVLQELPSAQMLLVDRVKSCCRKPQRTAQAEQFQQPTGTATAPRQQPAAVSPY